MNGNYVQFYEACLIHLRLELARTENEAKYHVVYTSMIDIHFELSAYDPTSHTTPGIILQSNTKRIMKLKKKGSLIKANNSSSMICSSLLLNYSSISHLES